VSLILDLSLRLHGGMRPGECVELARAADAAGFAGAWFAENPFARGILPAATACAIATGRLRIVAGVFNPFSRHPTMMAMEIGALDELAPGRVALGIGAGIASAVTRLGLDATRPVAALRDALAIVRGLLRGETVDHAGAVLSARNVKLDYVPRRDIAIFLAGRGERTLALCGEAADGLIVSNMCSRDFAAHAAAAVAAARREAGHAGAAQVVQYMPCAVDERREAAVTAAKRAVGAMLPGFWALGETVPSARAGLLAGTGLSTSELASAAERLRAGEDAARVLDERFVHAFSLAGTAEDCLAAAMRHARAGIGELALTFEGPTRVAQIAMLGEALAQARRRRGPANGV
jgi:5,10-methylenetetrahydromethanopterin reductase